MKNALVAVLVLGAVCSVPAFAGDGGDAKDLKQSILTQNIKTVDYFRSEEWSADLFGTYTAPEDGQINAGFGGGGGVNYFFNKFLGIGVEGGAFDGGGTADTVTYASGSFIARYPIESWHLAPYGFIGGGWHWGSDNIDGAIGYAGLGVEYRFTPHIGLFTDGRYTWADSSNNYGLARVGIRYAF